MKQKRIKHAWERVETHTWSWPLNVRGEKTLERLIGRSF